MWRSLTRVAILLLSIIATTTHAAGRDCVAADIEVHSWLTSWLYQSYDLGNCTSLIMSEAPYVSIKALASALTQQSAPRLRSLTLAGDGLSEIDPLVAVLKTGDIALQELNLEGNKIGADGAKALAQTPLEILDLTNNELGDAGAAAIAEALATRKGGDLIALFLNGNGITDTGARSLAKALPRNKRLKELSLSGNPAVTSHSLSAFERSLRRNAVLTKLSVDEPAPTSPITIRRRHNALVKLIERLLKGNARDGDEGKSSRARQRRKKRSARARRNGKPLRGKHAPM